MYETNHIRCACPYDQHQLAVDGLGGIQGGFAVRVVTPDPLLPLSGGVGPGVPAKEKRGDLTVRALVLENGGVRVAIVAGDFLGFPSVLGNRVRSQVKEIPGENILIAATHTHSAPDCYGIPDLSGKEKAKLAYLDSVCTKMAEAIHEALANARPARVKIATGEAKGKIAFNYYAPQLYDPRCSVIQCIGEDGKPLATLVNYAIHPEVLGNSQGICSPDLCGPLYEQIAAKGGGTAIFVNSAQGGMVTADNRDPAGGHDLAHVGRVFADRASSGRGRRCGLWPAPGSREPDAVLCGRQGDVPGRFTPNARLDQSFSAAGTDEAQREPSRHADEPRQPRQRANLDHSRRGLAEHRVLSEAEDARPAQSAVRLDQRRLRLHLDQSGLGEF